MENMECEQITPVEVISPAPSCLPLQNDQSIHQPKQQLRDRTPRKRRNKRLRPDDTTSPAPSCTSLQSDQSMDRPIKFQERTQNRALRPDETTSPAPSCTSLQSDHSMDRPIKFQERTQNRALRPDDTTSPAPSCTSLQSDHSMDRPIKFQERTQNRALRPDDTTSPAPSCTSLQSDHSMDRPIKFQERTQNGVFIKSVKEELRTHEDSLRKEVMSPDLSAFSATLLTEDHYRCSVCTEIFKNPVSIPCGHSYCKHCIEIYWNKPTQADCYACPQCRKRFRDRPVLSVNVALAKLIEELKRAGFSPALPAHCYAGPEDVSCDICSDMKLKAVKSCLTCCVSYCDTHVRQHYTVPALQRHNLNQVTISTKASVDTKEKKEFGDGKMYKIIEELREENKELKAKLSEPSVIVKKEEAEFSDLAEYFYSEFSIDLPKDVIEVVAVGRPLDLGMLYDCHNDSFTSDTFLWVNRTVSNKRVSLTKLKTHVRVLEDDSLQERCKAFEMSPMLRVSAQCGVIKLRGAAGFLNHPVQSVHQDRVTLHYKTTTRLDMISQTLLQEGVSPSSLYSTTATHVIIAVCYGAQAFFAFDNERIGTEKNTEMEDVVKKMISTFSVQDIRSSLTDAEKGNSILYDCSVYTDVGDWKSPVSFDKAVEIYSSLPELLGPKGERAVPLKVWLYPLKKLDKTPACAALSEVLLLKTENILENLRKQIMLCQDMMTDYDNLSVLTWFPTLTKKLKKFSDLLREYKTEFQRKIADIIQSINIDEGGEKTVQELIHISDQSPCGPTNTQRWLETKDIELVVLNLCRAANISIVKSQTELQRVLHDSQKSRVFCFTVSSLDAEDSFLTAMKQHVMVMKKQTLSREDCLKPEDILQLLKSVCISQNVVSDLQEFIATKETCEEMDQAKFIAASVPADCNGHTVQFFYDGKIVSRNVKLNLSPDPAAIIHAEDTSVHMKQKHPSDTSPERIVVEYRVMNDGINSNTWDHSVIDASALGETYTLTGLKPNTQYQLRCMAIYKDFMSYISENRTFKTCRFAPIPGQPFVNKLNGGPFRITWLKAEADEDCPVLSYMVEYKEAGLEDWSSVQTQGPQCEYTLTTPHSTCYRVRVSAVFKDITSKPSEETSVPVDVWRINLSKRKSSILLEVLKLQTEKKPVDLIDLTDEESEVRGFLQCLPYISQLRFMKPSNESSELWKNRKKLFILDLCLQAALCHKETIEITVKMLLSSVNYEKCDFLLELCSHVKNYESETGRSVLPALQSICHQSSPEVWRINLSERKSSILLEVLKLQTEKKPVELRDWTHEESEVRRFLQCLPYISQLRFMKPSNESSELWKNRNKLFILDLCLQAALCHKETIEITVKMLLSSVNYEKCDFLLDLWSHVKNYESETGRSVLPALQSIYHQSSPEVWRINLSERKSSILLEVLKLQTEKKPVELRDWTHEESEVRGFLQCLPYISELRSPLSSSESFEQQERRKRLLAFNLCLQEASFLKEITESSLDSLFSYIYHGNCDFLLDLCSHVKNYESETGRSVLPALQSIYHQSSPEVWRINLSERKSSILLEVLKLQTEKKPVELRDWTHEESEVRRFLQCLPYISQLSFSRNVLIQKRESAVQFLVNLFTAASEFDTNTEEKYTELLTSVCSYRYFPLNCYDDEIQMEQSDFLLDLFSHVKNCMTQTGKCFLSTFQTIYRLTPAVWAINLSERKSSILLEVLKLQRVIKPVELIDWTHEESEVRRFLQCLPYISQLRFVKPLNESSELWENRKKLFILDLCLQAALCQKETIEITVKMLLSSVNYEKCDFLLELCSHVKNYESETGRSVLPALQSICHQSSPEVWTINLSERKSSILLEVLKLQTEKKPVELRDWTHEESEVRRFLQCLPYISQLRFMKPSNESSELWKNRKKLFILDLCLQAALCHKETIEITVKMLLSSVNYEKCDFLLDLCSHVKNYESETGRSVLPALQSIYHQSSPEVWRINLSERKSSILLEVLKLQTEKKPVELRDWTHEESEVRGFLQCLPYISELRFTSIMYHKRESAVQFLVNLFTAASEFDTNTEEKYTELLTSVCSYTTFPFKEHNNLVQSNFLLDLWSHVKNYESETGRSVLTALQSIYHQSSPEVWIINLSKRKSSILLEVLKLQTEKKPVELRDWTHEESEVRGFLQCLPYISQLRFNKDFYEKRESAAQFLVNLFTAASEFDTNTEKKYTELLTSVCSYTTFPFKEHNNLVQSNFLLDLWSHVKNYESETGRSVLTALQSIYHQSSPEVWRINLSERKSSILLEVLKLQTEKKPVELRDWTHEESEVRRFLQCLPYISQLRFIKPSNESSELWENREKLFILDLCLQAALCQKETIEITVKMLLSSVNYEKCDFLLDLWSHVKNYESKTGRSVLPALQSIYHQSSPEVWIINLSERKSSILLEVLKLQTEKKPVELRDWTHEESEVRGFLQCLPYISQLRFYQFSDQDECFQFLVNLFTASLECETDTGEKYTELLTSVCNYTTFPFNKYYYDEDDEFQIEQCDFLLDLWSHVKNYESETGRSVLTALQSIYHQSSPEVWIINLSERKSSILLEVLKLQTEKKPVELRDWTHEESEVRGFLQCLPYISQLRFYQFDDQDECFQFLVNLFTASLECETDTGEKYTELLTSVCSYTTFPFNEYYYFDQSDFLLDLYSHVKNYESETGRSVLTALQSIYHQSSPAVWRINLSERKISILLEVLKLQTEKKPVELRDWTHKESEVRGFLQCLPYISELRNSDQFIPSVCEAFGLKVKRDQVTPLLQALMFTVTLRGKLPSSTCRCVGRVLSLSPSKLNLTLKPQAISLKGVRSLFRHITHLKKLSLEDRMVMMMVRALRSFKGHSLQNTEELSVVTKDSKRTHSRIVSSLTSLLRRLSVRCLDLTECSLEAVSVTALLCLQGLQTIRFSTQTLQQLVSVVCEAQDDDLTRCFLEKVSEDLTSCSLTWKEIQYLLQNQAVHFKVNLRKSKISCENIRELVPRLDRIQLKRLTPSFILSIIVEIYESRSPQYVSGLLSSAENDINLKDRVLDSVQCAALRFTLQHCNTLKLNLFWTSIPDEELKSFLPLLNRVTRLSVDRQLLLKLLHCCSSSDDQQEAADLLLSALQNKLDFSCCSALDLTVKKKNKKHLKLTNKDCRIISSVLQTQIRVVKLVLEDCKGCDTALKQLLPVLSQVKLSCSKDLLLQFLACISKGTKRSSVRWTRGLSQALGGELDLSHTQMDQRACEQLAVFLEYSDGLTELNLSHCKLTDQYMETLLPHLHKTQTLDLSYNSITDELANRIHRVVSTHNNIQTVRLFGNKIKDRTQFIKDKRFEIW